MTKADLRTGMVVENRISQRGVVMLNIEEDGDNRIVGSGDSNQVWLYLASINDDLTMEGNPDFDVIKVYGPSTDNSEGGSTSIDNRTIIFTEEAPAFPEGTVLRILASGSISVGELDNKLGMVLSKGTIPTDGMISDPNLIIKIGEKIWGLGTDYEVEVIE